MTGPCDSIRPLEDGRLEKTSVEKPFVTVIVTNYNYGRYILECLRGIASQTYDRFKCVVVDDVSSDDSVKQIKSFIKSKEAGDRFSLVERKENGGQLAAFQTGLEHAEGPFTTMVDADDVLLEDFIETHVRHHLGRYTVAFTSSNQYQINENSELIGGNHHDLQCGGDYRHVYHTTFYKPFWLWATTSSMMFRRSILNLVMPENVHDLKICADNYVVHMANLLGGSLLIPSVHGCYRRHGSNHFGSNPVIGGHLPVGDMDTHPEHKDVRAKVLRQLIRKHPDLYPIFSTSGYLDLIMRVATLEEITDLASRHKEIFPKPTSYYRRKYLFFRNKLKYWKARGTVRSFFARPKTAV